MRIKEPIITNKRYFKILEYINTGINYNRIIAEKLKIKPNTLIVTLQELEKENYLYTKKEKDFNRKIYYINFNKLAKEFSKDIKTSLLAEYRGYLIRYIPQEEVIRAREEIRELTDKLNTNNALPFLIESIFNLKVITKEFPDRFILLENTKNLRDLFVILYMFLKNGNRVINLKEINTDCRGVIKIINKLFEKYNSAEMTKKEKEFLKVFYTK